ncbi:MAG: hypothetical protein LC792_07280 [Actinobacteria bacterium]|nr:hypothetical protein [Actinomycetota bacterium]
MHSPTWAAAMPSGWQPVTLVMALEEAESSHRPEMITKHREVLDLLVEMGNEVLATSKWDGPERPPMGFNLLLFSAELASALNACSDRTQRRSCTETISAATLVAAACLGATATAHHHHDGG